MKIKKSIEFGERTLTVDINKVATQANGSAWVQYGDTVVLATATRSKEEKDVDFLPLLVNYAENTFAAGKIPGGFFKREGKPSDRETLICRLIDRPLRPLFPENYHYDTQIVVSVFSYDEENNPDVLGITSASIALYLSDIPFNEPIAGVRVGLKNDEFILNPPCDQLEESDLDLIVAGTEDAIMMVECEANDISEEKMLDALDFAHKHIKELVNFQKQLYNELKPEKIKIEDKYPITEELLEEVREKVEDKLLASFYVEGKKNQEEAVDDIKEDLISDFDEEEDEEKIILYKKAFSEIKKSLIRKEILEKGKRPDGRKFKDVRPLEIEVGILPKAHGSAIFKRGETQALATTTLGSFTDEQIMDNLVDSETSKKFMVHYRFPPFSVGEVSPLRAPSRREIGHGNLAERALKFSIPGEEKFPYTIRLVSEILESNGSSSMATVCGGCLSLMDTGVPVKTPVAGVAMGLVKEGDKYAILTDIAGLEDHYGDMDFKIAGSDKGISALQMDIKIKGISRKIMEEALKQAKEAKSYIMTEMLKVLPETRKNLSPIAPRVSVFTINEDKIKDVIGPGGRHIKDIINSTDTKINIEQDGRVVIVAPNEQARQEAEKRIKKLSEVPKVGKVYEGEVNRIENYGMFVEILPRTSALVHISQIADARVNDIRKYFEIGDKVKVKISGTNEKGQLKLSRKAVNGELPPPKKNYRSKSSRRNSDNRNKRKPRNYKRSNNK